MKHNLPFSRATVALFSATLGLATPVMAQDLAPAPIIKAVPTVPQQLDFQTTYEGEASSFIVNELASSLLQFDTASLKAAGCGQMPDVQTGLRPNLAESWTVDPDGKFVEFKLRQGVKSAAGNEMTAKDVKWSIDRGLKQSPIMRFLAFKIDSFEEEPVEIVDDYTIRVKTKSRTIFDLVIFHWSQFEIYDSAVVQEHVSDADPVAAEWLKKNSPNFGPWQLSEAGFMPGQRVTMQPNPNYWDAEGRGNGNSLIVLGVPESSTRAQLLRSGEIDFAAVLPFDEYASLKEADGVTVENCVSAARDTLLLNYEDEHLGNPLVRQAISYAIDREAIVQGVFKGFAKPAVSGISASYNVEGLENYISHDLEKAKALMTEAGYADGFSMSFVVSPTRPGSHAEQEAIFIKDSLAKIGITADIELVASGTTFSERFFKGNYQAMLYQELPAFADPFYSLSLMNYGESFQNTYHYKNADYDKLVSEGLHLSADKTDRRNEILVELSKIMAKDRPQVYLIDTGIPQARSSSVAGWEIQMHSAGNITAYKLKKSQ
ncbi:ABC transporter substrate-binding protein [uncultured Cohaesibacter sp.]|uniref:ABC transporter substrate-binding protein n=1 Tax=uncultured Cohaesibacter sp. TaxID=1002546 RepID=UPI0029C6E495|nr:ABC transporter substrate-binding protein [uncultured Cohaesibacter sp.]